MAYTDCIHKKIGKKVLYVVILEQKPQLRATGPKLVSGSRRGPETTEDNFDALTPWAELSVGNSQTLIFISLFELR